MDALIKRFKLARIFRGREHVQHLEPLLPASAPGHITSTSYDISHPVVRTAGAAPVKQSRTKQMVFLFGSCCGGQRRTSRPKRERKHRRSRRERKHHLHATSRTPVPHPEVPGLQVAPLAATSVASDSEYHDAREAWSVGDLDHSPLSSAQISPRAGSLDYPHGDEAYQDFDDAGSSSGSESGSELSSTTSAESTGIAAKLVSCLSIIRASSAGEDDFAHRGTPRAHYHQQGARSHRLPAGCTFPRRSPDVSPDKATLCWDECEATNFQIRSTDYMQTKVKQRSSKAIYRLVGMDLFGTDTKAHHVSRIFQLPHTGPPVVCRPAVPGGPEVALPQLLIMNVQLPDYPAAFWGASDGRGQSIVYYFQLRDDFDPDKFENTAALGLLQRFVSNGRESDGSPTRDRLKLIVRVANLEEWARVGPLNNTEYKLLQNYNEKPVLTRPQQHFHLGNNYLEVDLDVHNYAFLARKALWSYHDRISTVVWDMGFVIQGNCPEELPEQVLGCGRIYRSDFRQFKYLSELQHSLASGSITPSLTSVSASRNSAGFERVASPGASSATSATPATAATPDGLPAPAGPVSSPVIAAAGGVAASAGVVGAVAAVAAGEGSPGSGFVSPESSQSHESGGTSSAASADVPLVVSISPDGSTAEAATAGGSQAGKRRGSSHTGAAANGVQKPAGVANS